MNEKFHILIAEDNWMTRTVLSDYLTQKGYVVFPAENGLEGLRILEQRDVDLVITDYSMPLMGGNEFILHLKKNHPRLPVILISGFELNEKDSLQQIRDDLYDYFQKPINLGLLQVAVKKVQQETLYE